MELEVTTPDSVEFLSFTRTFPLEFWIGVGLSVCSSLFIGASFIIKKAALQSLSEHGKRANEGGYGYLTDSFWWAGLISMGIGEALNFVAYAFAPASVVSTLGVLSVLVATVLSSQFLHERLNFLWKIGCFLCAVGSIVIVIHAPVQRDVQNIEDLERKIFDPVFLVYVALVVLGSLLLIFYVRPKCSTTSTNTLVIWLGICSMIGSLSVMFCKGLGLAIENTIDGRNEFKNYLSWVCLGGLLICVAVQMNFLNKALDTFATGVVTPIYYVFFTTCVICASAILYREFSALAVNDWIGLFCGFAIVLAAIFLLHFCKNYNITLATLAQQVVLTREDEERGSGYFVVPVEEPQLGQKWNAEKVEIGTESRKSSISESYGATENTGA